MEPRRPWEASPAKCLLQRLVIQRHVLACLPTESARRGDAALVITWRGRHRPPRQGRTWIGSKAGVPRLSEIRETSRGGQRWRPEQTNPRDRADRRTGAQTPSARGDHRTGDRPTNAEGATQKGTCSHTTPEFIRAETTGSGRDRTGGPAINPGSWLGLGEGPG